MDFHLLSIWDFWHYDLLAIVCYSCLVYHVDGKQKNKMDRQSGGSYPLCMWNKNAIRSAKYDGSLVWYGQVNRWSRASNF